MWKFCTLTFLYGAVFLWHQRRSPSLAEVSAEHTRVVSTGSQLEAQQPVRGVNLGAQAEGAEKSRGKRPWDEAAAVWCPFRILAACQAPGAVTHLGSPGRDSDRAVSGPEPEPFLTPKPTPGRTHCHTST